MGVASRWAVLAMAVPLLLLAGCTGTQPYTDLPQTPAVYEPPEPKPYVAAADAGGPPLPVLVLPGFNENRPSSPAAPPPVAVEAPRLRPGSQFLFETITESSSEADLGGLPVRANATHGLRMLATGLTLEDRPVVLAARLGHFGRGLTVTGATTLDPATLAQRDLADLAWLNDCQEKPERCPTDLKVGLPGNMTERPKVPFPLRVGKEWTDVAFHEEAVGSWACRVEAINTTMLLGALDVAVWLACDAIFPLNQEEGSTFQTGAATMRWRAVYSDALGILVAEARTEEVRLHVEDLEGVRDLASMSNRTVHVIDATLADEPEPDMVELYTLLNRTGRSLRTSLSPYGDFRYNAHVFTEELPNSTIAWSLRDGAGKVWQQGQGKAFNVSLEPGSYLLRVEAVHHGKVLMFQERPLLRHLFVEGEKTCSTVVVVLPTGANGSCPKHQFEVRGGVSFLYVWVAGYGNGEGTFAILDPRNVTQGTSDWGWGLFWLEPLDAAGTWTLEPRPEVMHDGSYQFEVVAIYEPLKPQQPG
ncbi:MAG: hypothetical protein QOD77_505 [Thermoplasmata archaeon]|jgi:hypothetical protein|nr:hypothetical protein [Thermoplasmata archaeon]